MPFLVVAEDATPEEQARMKRDYIDHNRRVHEELVELGLTKSGQELAREFAEWKRSRSERGLPQT
jgi:hypothetical protein